LQVTAEAGGGAAVRDQTARLADSDAAGRSIALGFEGELDCYRVGGWAEKVVAGRIASAVAPRTG
jgi:hypothetical protein